MKWGSNRGNIVPKVDMTLLDDDTKPHDVLEKIMDDTFILSCIEATNEHGANDPNFVNTIGEIAADEKGIYFVRGFFAIKWHIRLLRYPQMKWAWSEDPLKSQPEIKNNVFRSVSVNVEAISCS